MFRDSTFQQYLKLLLKWNHTYNLTAITNKDEIWVKHFEDSLVPLPFLPQKGRLLDIGTGAGFPGIPLKIVRPELEVVVMDSTRKKISFCEALIRELELKDIEIIHGRAEDPEVIQKLGLFDVVISRATFSLSDFLWLASPYLKEGDLAIGMKGSDWEKEYRRIPHWILKKSYFYNLSKGFGQRVLLIFKKN